MNDYSKLQSKIIKYLVDPFDEFKSKVIREIT